MELTLNDKLLLMEIDEKKLEDTIREELFMKTLHTFSDMENNELRHITDECLNVDIELAEPEINTRLSIKMLGGKVVVIKTKKFNIARFIHSIMKMANINIDSELDIVYTILEIFSINFISLLDSDRSLIYSYLCKRYYIDFKAMSIEETYKDVENYINNYLNLGWSKKHIRDTINELENEYKVIKFEDDKLKVIDEIMFN